MSTILVTKGKLKKESVEFEFERKEEGKDKPVAGTESSDIAPHKDLVAAFGRLRIHAALFCDFVSQKQVKNITDYDEKLVEDLNVTGFTVKGGAEVEGVILTVNKKIARGSYTFNTPLIRNVDDEKKGYLFIDDLIEQVQICQHELEEYHNGKYAPNPQGELFTSGEEK